MVPRLATVLQVNPQRDLTSAVDLEAWVASLPEDAQEILAMRQAGLTLADRDGGGDFDPYGRFPLSFRTVERA